MAKFIIHYAVFVLLKQKRWLIQKKLVLLFKRCSAGKIVEFSYLLFYIGPSVSAGLTPPLCTVDWFAKNQKEEYISKHKRFTKRQKTNNVYRYANNSKSSATRSLQFIGIGFSAMAHTNTHTHD